MVAAGQNRIATVSIVAAAILVALKLGTGLAVGSLALISAGIESSGDVVAAIVTFVAVRLGARPADADHPYGHRRVENLAALTEAAILAGGGVIVCVEAIRKLSESAGPVDTGWYIFVVIAIAVAIDVSRIGASLSAARRYQSAAFRSNAFHFAGDLVGSLAVVVGLLLVKLGIEQGDALAALFVAAIIFLAVARLISENAGALMDRAPAELREAATRALEKLEPNIEVRRLRLRESAGRVFADVVVAVPPASAVVEGHATAERVEHALNEAIPQSDVVVHVEPREHDLDLRQQVLAAALSEPLVVEAHDILIFSHDENVVVSLHLKFPADLSLQDAHAISERIEDRIASTAPVDGVETHLEPLEQPISAAPADPRRVGEHERTIREVVRSRIGQDPADVRVVSTAVGLVVFLTVTVGPDATLAEAHRIASQLEEALRRQVLELAEVVVHTEP